MFAGWNLVLPGPVLFHWHTEGFCLCHKGRVLADGLVPAVDIAVQTALLTRNAMQIAAAMQIKPGNFRWYAAFHDESYHPHVHMIAWSIDPKEAYLTTKGIGKIKAQLAQDIFQNDLLEIYTAQTKTRDELRQGSREKLETALTQIEQGCLVGS